MDGTILRVGKMTFADTKQQRNADDPICYLDYHDIAGQIETADRALALEVPSVIAIVQAWIVWLVPLNGEHACIQCFQLWRFDSLSLNAFAAAPSSNMLDAPFPAGSPLIEALLRSYLEVMQKSHRVCETVRRIDLHSGAVSDHPLLGHSECDRCRLQKKMSTEPQVVDPRTVDLASKKLRASTLDQIAKNAFPGLVDQRLGLVRFVEHHLSPPLLSVAKASLCAEDAPRRFENGYGRTGNLLEDPAIAVIEAMERYAGMRLRSRKETVRGCYDGLKDRAVDPELFILHADEQRDEPGFRLARYDSYQEIDWVWAYSFRHSEPRLVPAQLAYYGLRPSRFVGGEFVFEVSNGCAAGSTMLEAALFGLLEVIERDAFLASWYSCRQVTQIDGTSCSDSKAKALMARLRAEGLQVSIFDIGVGLPSAALAVKIVNHDRRFGPSMAYAAAAHVTAERALVSALQERQ
jgi:hypothetical protein